MKMRFKENMYYTDLVNPIFIPDQVYDVPEENGWAARWLKRGGEEVTEETDNVVSEEVKTDLEETPEVSNQEALDALGSEEEVAKPEVKVENKKGKNTKR